VKRKNTLNKKIDLRHTLFIGTKEEMDREVKTQRNKKSDKAKKTYERNGGFSQKHVRQTEALAEKTAVRTAVNVTKKK